MPRGDRTGPNGVGSRSGRGAGLCNGNNVGGFASSGQGGRNLGSGRRLNRAGLGNANQRGGVAPNQGIATNTTAELQQQMHQMQQQLNNLTDAIKQLDK